MVTCYDYWSAQLLNQTNIDCLLVGDSLAMVMHGHANTIPADIELMALHTKAVVRGAPDKFVIADMPFFSATKAIETTLDNVELLMRAGAHAVKVECMHGQTEHIKAIVNAGVPVMGHLGLTIQAIHQQGGFRLQNKGDEGLEKLLHDARLLEQAGCFALVLECIPANAAAIVTKELNIPTIGIGAGIEVDGQVLVLQDLLGLNTGFKPKFLKTYLNGGDLVMNALNHFDQEVKSRTFPTKEYSYQ